MANQDAAFGLRPLKTVGQQDDSTGFSSHTIDAGEGSAMYQGSVVNATTTGFVDISANDAELNLGAFWGCFYVDPTTLKPTFKNYYPGAITPPSSKNIEAFVYDNPQQLFEIQSDNTGASAQTDVFMCADLSSPTGGSTTNGVSSMELGDSTINATAAVLKIIGVSRDPANSDLTAANVNWRVMIDQHLFGHNYDGI